MKLGRSSVAANFEAAKVGTVIVMKRKVGEPASGKLGSVPSSLFPPAFLPEAFVAHVSETAMVEQGRIFDKVKGGPAPFHDMGYNLPSLLRKLALDTYGNLQGIGRGFEPRGKPLYD